MYITVLRVCDFMVTPCPPLQLLLQLQNITHDWTGNNYYYKLQITESSNPIEAILISNSKF